MEKLDVFDCANVFIASYFTDDRGCAHCNREHTLLYIHSGELEITDGGRKTVYSLTGVRLLSDAESTASLDNGIYIINGRKTLISR